MQIRAFFSFLILLLGSLLAFPQGSETNELSEAEIIKKVDGMLHFKQGLVTLPKGIAKLNLPASFRYLPPEDAEIVLSKVWGNPPGIPTLGMIFPSDVSPASHESWGVVITYAKDGYVKDSDADSIDYDKLLKEMKLGSEKANKERMTEGYGSMELVGWAAAPRYDKETHKMFWAKELKFADSKTNTLNYNIRVLGRAGVLNLNAVALITQLSTIEQSTPEILKLVDFTDGNRYADFNQKTDKVAVYGLAALVAGGIAAKAGLFKGLIVLLIAAKKFIILGVIGIGAFFRKFFKGRKNSNTVPSVEKF
jgi:uncharacterized membrane-anchored protein